MKFDWIRNWVKIIQLYLNLFYNLFMRSQKFVLVNKKEVLIDYARVFAIVYFCFFLFIEPIALILNLKMSFNTMAFIVIFSPILAIGFIFYERSGYWVRVFSFFYSVVIFSDLCFLFVTIDFTDLGFQVHFEFCPLPLFNYSIIFGIDGLSILFLILTSFLFSITFLSCWVNTKDMKFFSILLFFTEFLLFLVFTTLDLFVFFIVYEAVIIPIFLIIGIFGSRFQRVYASYLFFYYTFAGSMGMLFSIAYIYLVVGSTSFFVISNFNFTVMEQVSLFGLFFLAFAAKLPLYPLHSWLPEAHVEAPTSGSVLLAGILLKMGGYGIIRWCFSIFPAASLYSADIVNTIGCVSVLYASFSALQQLDIKRIIAYSSIAHMGFVVIGLFTFTNSGVSGSIFLMITHGFISAGLFLCVGVLYERYGTRSILYYGGLGQLMPVFDTVFFILCLANIALPGTAGFPGEFLILYSAYYTSPLLVGALLIGVLLTGIYTIWMYSRLMMGPIDNLKGFIIKFSDINLRELSMFSLLIFLVFIIGLFPNLIFRTCVLWINSL